jgi:hypothetical protein
MSEITFRTETGSRYTYDGATLVRLSERPVEGLDPRPQVAEMDALAPVEVGRRAIFWIDGVALTTSRVVEVVA